MGVLGGPGIRPSKSALSSPIFYYIKDNKCFLEETVIMSLKKKGRDFLLSIRVSLTGRSRVAPLRCTTLDISKVRYGRWFLLSFSTPHKGEGSILLILNQRKAPAGRSTPLILST